jgi:hypothetical protein
MDLIAQLWDHHIEAMGLCSRRFFLMRRMPIAQATLAIDSDPIQSKKNKRQYEQNLFDRSLGPFQW